MYLLLYTILPFHVHEISWIKPNPPYPLPLGTTPQQ